MNTLISKETEVTSRILQVVVSSFRSEQINTVPFAGSRTGAGSQSGADGPAGVRPGK